MQLFAIKTESKQRKKFLVVEKKKEMRENDLPSVC